ncbi:hypothetical protein VC83_04669 [Pseudogymnoascus destructans]|uniref:WSC domain-containing protein n=1 Tax=Pseudogymnoascus destructans TaxID=655981 RepID=A0A177A709_9PEZI|nr:uncharacterized protein VC83_04669 [Pseudogymnoascus destructans]OAF57262.1 hypothetical protein VC83_04669 [Pseudogymnoascus destructans]
MVPPLLQMGSLSILLLAAVTPSLAASVNTAGLPVNWSYKGCYVDSVAARVLSGSAYNSDSQTEGACASYCGTKGFKYAGVEYGVECYCGNVLTVAAAEAEADCAMACAGNADELCGGPNRINVFENTATSATSPATTSATSPATTTVPTNTAVAVAGWTAGGCYTDNVAARSLPQGVAVAGNAAMTITLCLTACQAAGYRIAGLEYASQCYCGNAFANGGALAPDGNAQCNMPCDGNPAETCGGPDRLNVFFHSGSSGDSGTGWSYKGCWVDNKQGRIMNGPQADLTTMTIESCIATCVAAGYAIAGLQYSSQCFCDNELRNAATLAAVDSMCSTPCAGSTVEICGGGNLDSVYAARAIDVIGPAAPQKAGLPGLWQYKGCLMDQDPKSLPEKIAYAGTNTGNKCLKACSDYGYNAAGMEYGEECYCGDKSDPSKVGAKLVAESDCSTPCPGDARYLCGAGNRLSYYEWVGAPIQNYGFPQGAAAGEYVLLGKAPVIALITTQGLNGKVTFVEKSGTSTTPGSTGAYEWDPSANTFRTMHVKTDVFCSAGLVLPDKVGRQINIGGWSGDSTYGIRLYWPDGSPGTASVNDWQENYQELALQNGRWYPSAMVMANGSILVVGGENGSNGPPVPTLELLPRAGGALYMEWLQRTDPYNLYPFLAVLPSGGIFVAYYNEAIILDEKTFATQKKLPNIPGAVNNPLGGRTYPLEGTMVLLPQHAPYTEPLGVLICGGSTPFGGYAIDNCVSTVPEAANPTWTIEKMPSKRVMSCICALPDGTYLILNGAHVGVAGFGLASNPNHNALLYDPTKPINSRISIMANTTIDRFYHSEAILLQDGRVLVTGSDPETDGLEQEYRIEAFIPPYLKTGRPVPSYTITDKDWKYGETVTVTVTLPSGGVPKFSLMGAESSTHGNSMGQRTIFPAFTCTRNSCTITAPPTAHVAPPGWHQLFLLEGGVPSKSQYVRIGGDPGNLGAWPKLSDFKVPGSG